MATKQANLVNPNAEIVASSQCLMVASPNLLRLDYLGCNFQYHFIGECSRCTRNSICSENKPWSTRNAEDAGWWSWADKDNKGW